jgi:UDP-N-acetylmuramoyl-tripeptide--D-alanyl-D-alanine ligase
MKTRRLSWIARVVGGSLVGEDATASGAQFDSRLIRPGDLFFAIRDALSDGHPFVRDAFERGASGAIVGRAQPGLGSQIVVPNTWRALATLARAERAELRVPVVAVTGSTGKTTTKDFIRSFLPPPVLVVSPRSFNNLIGVSLTVLSAGPKTRAIVCELGTHGPGDMRWLVNASGPTIGVITNIGVAHIGKLGSRRAIADEKATLARSLPPGGTAVLNADDPMVRSFVSATSASPLLYGLSEEADVRGRVLSHDRECRTSIAVRWGDAEAVVKLPLPGRHSASNALAAIACGVALGLPLEGCAAALRNASLTRSRLELFDSPRGFRVLDDAFNANPHSMASGLRTAVCIAGGSRVIAVMTGMVELGSISAREHFRVGARAARLPVELLITVGRGGRSIGDAAIRMGMPAHRVIRCASAEEAFPSLLERARSGDLVLLKGLGRLHRLDRIADALRAGADTLEPPPAAVTHSGPPTGGKP